MDGLWSNVNGSGNKENKIQLLHPYIACCFQGGGALGAYQIGVLHALDEAGYYPNWFAGTSIGAINAAIAAGNPPNVRIEKMHQFWNTIATPYVIENNLLFSDEYSRKLEHFISAQTTLLFGQPGFFMPRFPPLLMGYYDAPDTISFYDTKELKSTLEQLIDFDRLNNSKEVRISLGSVEVRSGQMVYFDSKDTKIGPEHVMASGALPPGFPAIEIEGEFYWDGGISSNSPVTYVLSENRSPRNLLVFAIHLFDSYGLHPTSLDGVMKRKKDIEYSSRFSKAVEMYQQIHKLKNSIHLLSRYVPKEEKIIRKLKSVFNEDANQPFPWFAFYVNMMKRSSLQKITSFPKKPSRNVCSMAIKMGEKPLKLLLGINPYPKQQELPYMTCHPSNILKTMRNNIAFAGIIL